MRLAIVVVLGGCAGKGQVDRQADDGGGDPPTTDPSTPTEDTAGEPGTTGPPPDALEVACAATENPLRFLCTVEVDPPQAVELGAARTDGLGAARASSSSAVAATHAIPLYFLAPERTYAVTAWASANPGTVAETAVTTGAVPASVASSLAVTGTSTMGLIGSHFPCESDATAVVYDTATGELVWFQQLLQGGTFGSLDMVQFTEDFTVLGESEGDVVEVDLLGADVVRLPNLTAAFGVTADGFFGNFHHDIMKRNGVYYVFYQETYSGGFDPDILDTVILFDGTGTEIARWDPIDHLALPPDWGGDFMHTNTIFVDETGDILLSWFSQGTIAKIEGDWTSPEFGTPRWILRGNNGGELGNTITTDWSAVSPRSFDEQHSLMVRPDGRLQLLDNPNGRGLVISLDEATATATVDGAYDTREADCGPQGTSRSTLGGNPVIGCMGDWVREYDLGSGEMIWEADVQCPGGGPHDGAARWYPLDGW
jgi:hypothetical protein